MNKIISEIIIWGIVILAVLWLIGNILGSIHTTPACEGMTEEECRNYSDMMGNYDRGW